MKKAQRAAGLTSKAKPSSSTAKKQSKKRPVSDQQAEAAGPPPGKRPRPPQPKGSTWAAAEPPKAAAKPPKAAKRKSSSKKASSEGVANGEAPSLPAQPRPHYHISPERSFFDQAKEVLSAQSKEAWGEFVKCLELYSQEVVSRAEMLQLAGDLLSGAGTLLDDFKRMLMSIGSSHAEMGGITWHRYGRKSHLNGSNPNSDGLLPPPALP
jgi:histone deacetylase complex regulatory component SIN3